MALTRRELIGTAAAGAAAAALPLESASAAARSLVRRHRSVLVLEARGRVGGRTFNHPLGDGQVIEAGGEFVGPTQDRVVTLAKEVGLTIFDAYNQGQNVLISQGVRSTYPA